MKKEIHFLFTLLTAMLLLCPTSGSAQKKKEKDDQTNRTFLQLDDMPDAGIYLPPPPSEHSNLYYTDSCMYVWGKSIRNTPRGAQARADADHSIKYFAKIFSEPFGVTISKENTPYIYYFLQKSVRTFRLGVTKAKDKYKRLRPYVYYNEPTLIPEEEEEERNTGSYPSGHTVRGWGAALVLSTINPARQNEILKRGYEYGQSRVIAGYHYQSDVDAARMAASACYARMQNDRLFKKQLKRAQREFKKVMRKNHQ